MSTLCTTCTNLDIKDFTDWDNDIQDVPHVDSLWTLKQSSVTCTLCRLLYTEFEKATFFKAPEQEEEKRSSSIILRGAQHVDEEWNTGGIYLIRARCDSLGIKAWIGVYADEGKPSLPYFKLYGINY